MSLLIANVSKRVSQLRLYIPYLLTYDMNKLKAQCNGCRERRYLNDKYLCRQCVELDEYDAKVLDQIARESC